MVIPLDEVADGGDSQAERGETTGIQSSKLRISYLLEKANIFEFPDCSH